MPIRDYCRRDPVTVDPGDSIQDVARRMESAGVGCIVVVDEARRPLGVVTDRDLALRVLRRGTDPGTAVREVLEGSPITVSDAAPVTVAARFMRDRGLRRIPVVDSDSGAIAGIMASDDLLQLVASELDACAAVVREQFPADLRGERALPPRGGGA
jgi:CBS domain-containing protein